MILVFYRVAYRRLRRCRRHRLNSMRKICLIALLLAGCQQIPLHPYRIDIQQGNYVTQEMVAKLKPGMTRAQVRFALGAPLIVDPFHTDRWDYVYVYQKAGTVTEQRRIVVIFAGDKLVRIEGDVVMQPESAAKSDDKPAGRPLTPQAGQPDAKAGTAPAKPDATAPQLDRATAPKPAEAAPKADPGVPAAADSPAAGTGKSESANTGAPKPDAAKSDPPNPKPKPPEEKGFFGRMLDKIGF